MLASDHGRIWLSPVKNDLLNWNTGTALVSLTYESQNKRVLNETQGHLTDQKSMAQVHLGHVHLIFLIKKVHDLGAK